MLEAEQILQKRYKLKQKLAQNAGRQTWLAEDISIQPTEAVILKFLSFGENFQWQDLKLFEREADILKQLSHPRIPKYRDYFSIEDKYNWFALVEEYIPGDSLKQLIESKKRFTEQELRKIATDILDILDYLHTLNPQVIHRDIKPSNLILDQDKQVYLIDFGAVQDTVASQGKTFTVVGTYGYAPIEQFGGRTVPASDLYGLGATLIHLATGIIPADLPQSKMRIQFRDKVSLSDSFVRWIEKLVEPVIENRFKNAPQALDGLVNPLTDNSISETEKSDDSRIQLNKSENNLEIEITPAGFKFKYILAIVICIFWCLLSGSVAVDHPLISIPFWFYSLYIFNFYLFESFGKIFFSLDNKNFIIKWKLFSLTYEKLGDASAITNITDIDTSSKLSKNIFYVISINTSKKAYNFGGFLTDSERKWLIGEIKDWLGI